MIEKEPVKLVFATGLGESFNANVESALSSPLLMKYKGQVDLIFTSPPFPLNKKKKYGNKNGEEYIQWLANITTELGEYLSKTGSLVIEIGNAWEPMKPVMSTLPIRTLLSIQEKGNYELCQQFVWFNTAKLPSPVQWVNRERSRVKDSFTNIWWLSKTSKPTANNRNVLDIYSESMEKLLRNKKYNAGKRPSEHNIGEESFFKDHGGAIPSNVLVAANTASKSPYLDYCKEKGLTPHPARMPRYLPEFFIKFLTSAEDLVMDPFAGSNTTGAAAEALERRWVAIEAEMNYVVGSKARF